MLYSEIKQFRIDEETLKKVNKLLKKDNVLFTDYMRHLIIKDLQYRGL
jgi:hypothetical protein